MNMPKIPMGMAAALAVALATPAMTVSAQSADHDRPAAQAQDSTAKSSNKVEDAWILTKVKSKFVGEDALKDSDINVDVREGVVILKGTVASEAGRARAVAISKETDGVTRVDDRLAIGMAKAHDMDDKVGTAGHDTAEKADEAADKTKDAAKKAGDTTKETAGTAGEAVTDGWITTKVKSSFVGVDALDGSDINVDTVDHVVTLTGTVASELGRTEAVRIAKSVKGVTRVSDKLTIAPKR